MRTLFYKWAIDSQKQQHLKSFEIHSVDINCENSSFLQNVSCVNRWLTLFIIYTCIYQ